MFPPESTRLLQFSRRPERFHDRKEKHNLKPDEFGFVVLFLCVFVMIIQVEDSRKYTWKRSLSNTNSKLGQRFDTISSLKKVRFLRRWVKIGTFENVNGKYLTYCRFHQRLRVFWRYVGKVSCVTKGRNVEYGLWNMDYDMENVEWEI